MTERPPRSIDLPQPRPLTAAESALVSRLVAFVDLPTLYEQVATVRVVSTCDCGCASVGLGTEGPPVPAAVVARLSGTGREDYFAVHATAPGGVSIVLHVLSGTLGELELFAGDGVTVAAPPVSSLADLEVL